MSIFSGIQGAGAGARTPTTAAEADQNNYIAQDTATLNTIRIGRCTG